MPASPARLVSTVSLFPASLPDAPMLNGERPAPLVWLVAAFFQST
jgi:hypothetical protein